MRYYGCHVSVAGGMQNAINNAEELGVNTIQIHPTPPQRWNRNSFASGYENKFLEAKANSSVDKVFFHGIYLINLASPDPEKVSAAVKSLQFYLELADRIAADGVIFHVGSNKEQENSEVGLKQAADAISRILDTPQKSRLLLEVSAGSGKIIGAKMEELRYIYDLVGDKTRLGFALDTQHMWASGYDFKDHGSEVAEEVDKVFGSENVYAIHLNDSKSALASHVDRHENLGQGQIGAAGLSSFVNHSKMRHIPLILETPALKDLDGAKGEVKALKELLQ